MSIPVYWWEGIAGLYAHEGVHGRSRYACTGLLNDALDAYDCEHISGHIGLENRTDYAVVIIHGGHLRHQVEEINQSIANLQAVICIGIGDEENDFSYHELRHRNMKLWMQSPVPNKSRADRYPIVGYPCDIHEHLVSGQERNLDWFFSGQVTNARRHECTAVLRNMSGGLLLETKQFYSGMPHDEYFKTLGRAKVIPCPSGPVCSDTFRLSEALEAGCVPIIDEHPGWKEHPTTGFWNTVFPQGFPFPMVEKWTDLPKVMDNVLQNYSQYAASCRQFWVEYKRNYFLWLGQDLRTLGINL